MSESKSLIENQEYDGVPLTVNQVTLQECLSVAKNNQYALELISRSTDYIPVSDEVDELTKE